MMNNKELVCELKWSEKQPDGYLGTCPIAKEVIINLKEFIKVKSEESLTYIRPLSEIELNYLQPYVEHEIELNKYQYFINSLTMNNEELEYELAWTDIHSGEFIGSYTITKEVISKLKEFLNIESEHDFTDFSPLSERELNYLELYIEQEIDSNKYDYSINCHTIKEQSIDYADSKETTNNEKKVKRQLEWFEKENDPLIGSCILPEEVVPTLKKFLDIEPEDDLIYDYLLSEQELNYLQLYVEHKIDLSQYDYFFGTYSVK